MANLDLRLNKFPTFEPVQCFQTNNKNNNMSNEHKLGHIVTLVLIAVCHVLFEMLICISKQSTWHMNRKSNQFFYFSLRSGFSFE